MLLTGLGLLLGLLGASVPMWAAFLPRLGLWPLQLMRPLRAGLGSAAAALALAGWSIAPSGWTIAGVVLVAFFGLLMLFLEPGRLFVPLDRPERLPAEAAGLADGAPILGLSLGGEARAWPMALLAPHHIANDQLGGTPLLVSY